MPAEVEVIGRFVPSEFTSETIQAGLRTLLPRCCQCENIGVRIPQGIIPHPNNLEYHQDGGGTEGTTRHMVVWASEIPTEIRDSSGVELRFKPFDIVWYNNDLAYHRQPRGTNESTRWFAAVRCSGVIF